MTLPCVCIASGGDLDAVVLEAVFESMEVNRKFSEKVDGKKYAVRKRISKIIEPVRQAFDDLGNNSEAG